MRRRAIEQTGVLADAAPQRWIRLLEQVPLRLDARRMVDDPDAPTPGTPNTLCHADTLKLLLAIRLPISSFRREQLSSCEDHTRNGTLVFPVGNYMSDTRL